MRKLICAILSVILLLGTAVTAWAEDTATLTITPDKTEVMANGSAVQVKFTITVTPPEGRERRAVHLGRIGRAGAVRRSHKFRVQREGSGAARRDRGGDGQDLRALRHAVALRGADSGKEAAARRVLIRPEHTLAGGHIVWQVVDRVCDDRFAVFLEAPWQRHATGRLQPEAEHAPVTVKGTGGTGTSGSSGDTEKPETGGTASGETPDVTDKPDVPREDPSAAGDPQVVISPAPGAADAPVPDTAQTGGAGTKLAAIVLGVLAAAGAVCQLVIPGGLGRLFRRDGRSK